MMAKIGKNVLKKNNSPRALVKGPYFLKSLCFEVFVGLVLLGLLEVFMKRQK